MTQTGRVVSLTLVLGGWTAAQARAESPRTRSVWSEAIPADIIAGYAWQGSGPHEASAADVEPDSPSAPRPLSLLDQAQALGLFGAVDEATRPWLDAVTAVSHLTEYPHAVLLFDVAATPRDDGGHELSGLSGGIMVETGRDAAPLHRLVQHLLDTYTNAEHSTLTMERLGTQTWMTLRDRRLPDWVVIRWAVIDDRYVIALGKDALQRVMDTLDATAPSLGKDDWFQSASRALNTSTASFWFYGRPADLRRRVDAPLGRKISDVLTSLRFGDVSRGLWITRREGRALTMGAFLRRGQTDEHERIADRRFRRRLRDGVIPEAATRYAIVDCNPVGVTRGVSRAYLSSRSPDKSERLRASWRRVQQTSGVDIERDILTRLAHTVVIHDHPPHPLNLPGVRTILLGVARDPEGLRANLDTLLTYVRDVLIPPGLFQLRRTDDGIWHVLYGINGPALTVLDRWVVVGFTPAAVREVRALLQPGSTDTDGS